MKTIKILLTVLALLTGFSAAAQNQELPNSQHATVQSLKVMYKAVPQATLAIDIMAIPQATVNLKNAGAVSKIYFKIIDKNTNAIIYQANYALNSGTVNSDTGKKLFENNNGAIFISNGQTLLLKPYLYQLQTQDAQNNLSTIYSLIQ